MDTIHQMNATGVNQTGTADAFDWQLFDELLEQIRQRRACLTATDLSRVLDVNQATLHKYKSRARKPSLERMDLMASLLKFDTEELVSRLTRRVAA